MLRGRVIIARPKNGFWHVVMIEPGADRTWDLTLRAGLGSGARGPLSVARLSSQGARDGTVMRTVSSSSSDGV
jgi:hypothetical protein